MGHYYGRIKTAALATEATEPEGIGFKPQPWRPQRHAKRAVGAKHLGGSKGREV